MKKLREQKTGRKIEDLDMTDLKIDWLRQKVVRKHKIEER